MPILTMSKMCQWNIIPKICVISGHRVKVARSTSFKPLKSTNVEEIFTPNKKLVQSVYGKYLTRLELE